MEVRVLTLRYSPELGVIDDAPLLALGRDHEVLGIREHFFIVHDVPHLLCVVSCQRRAGATAAADAPAPTRPAESRPQPVAIVEPSRTPSPEPGADLTDDQRLLFDAIRRWRITQAEHDGVPRYVVLTNRNVDALVRERPDTLAALRRIDGIGKTKAERYGEAILGLLHPERATPAPRPVKTPNSPQPSSEPTPDGTSDPAVEA